MWFLLKGGVLKELAFTALAISFFHTNIRYFSHALKKKIYWLLLLYKNLQTKKNLPIFELQIDLVYQ